MIIGKYQKLKSLAVLFAFAGASIACESDLPVEDIRSQDEYVDQSPISYDHHNEIIPGEYIVLLKTDNPSSKYPELITMDQKDDLLSRAAGDRSNMINLKANNDVNISSISKSILKTHGIDSKQIIETFDGAAPGFLVTLSARDAVALENDPDVDVVEEDRLQALNVAPLIRTPFVPSTEGEDAQQIPYGVEAMGGAVNYETNPDWKNKWVWIVDTGIDKDHPELNVIESYSRDFTKDRNFDDEHGHGTHVAGIIAAKENNSGVSGVAAGAQLVAIKVLDRKGKGKLSHLVKGLSYIKRYCLPNDVVNISLGGKDSKALDKIMKKLDKENIHIVMAAGNSGKHAKHTSPGNINGKNLYTVGAVDWDGNYMDYSNFGENVDFAAPGHGILSTYPGGKYAYMSGTSMAAPHVAGVMLLDAGLFINNGSSKSKTGDVPKIKHRKKGKKDD